MNQDILIQQPTPAKRLILLFHGVGSSPQSMEPVGEAVARRFPDAAVVCIGSPNPSELGSGWQWFSVQGVTEDNRPARVTAAMPAFQQVVHNWQARCGLGPARTVLIGFSQGAIMALESTQQTDPVAHTVVSMAGRFVQAPRKGLPEGSVHFLHGTADGVMPVTLSQTAAAQLQHLGTQVTLHTFEGLGHGVDSHMLQRLLDVLQPD